MFSFRLSVEPSPRIIVVDEIAFSICGNNIQIVAKDVMSEAKDMLPFDNTGHKIRQHDNRWREPFGHAFDW